MIAPPVAEDRPVLKPSVLLTNFPDPPWVLEGAIGLSIRLHSRRAHSRSTPPSIESCWSLGHRVAGLSIWGHVRHENSTRDDDFFDFALFLSGPVAHGSHRGWWAESSITGDPGIYGGLKSTWGFPSFPAKTFYRGDRARGQFELDMGNRFFAEAGFQRLLPGWRLQRTLSIWTLKDQRLHRARLTFSGTTCPAFGACRLPRNRILPQLHGLNVLFGWIPAGRLEIHPPEDIDLRGYRPT